MGVRVGVWANGGRGGDVVVEAACFVESDEEGCFVPLRARTHRLVYILDQRLAIRNQTRRVHGRSPHTAATSREDGELGQAAGGGVGVEVGEGFDEVGVVGGVSPVEPEGVGHGGFDVVGPGVVCFGELLEDGALVHDAVCEGVVAVAGGGAGVQGDAVRVGGLGGCVSR